MHKVIEVLKTKFRGNSSSVGITATTGIAATHIGGVTKPRIFLRANEQGVLTAGAARRCPSTTSAGSE